MMRLCSLALCCALALQATLLAPSAAARQSSAAHPLTLAARVWGLAKYHHPQVTACALDWDRHLLDAIAPLEAAGSASAREAVLTAMLDAAGDGGRRAADAATPEWIVHAPVSDDLRERLAWLAAQRPGQQCYVDATPGTEQARFDLDTGHASDSPPDRAHRALAAFRFWNAIEYFFPYKAEIGRDWSSVLDQALQPVLEAATHRDYVLAVRALTAAIEDSHAGFSGPPIADQPVAGGPPFWLRLIEGQPVVVEVLEGTASVQPGDVLLAVDGASFAARRQQVAPLLFGSNPAAVEANALRRIVAGPANPGVFRLRRPDGSEYDASLPRSWEYRFGPLAGQPVWHERALPGGCSMGVIDMGRLEPAQADAALADLAHTDALVFDVRNYPLGALAPVIDRLYTEPRTFSIIQYPDLTAPGVFLERPVGYGGMDPMGYQGRVLILHDERSISHSEFTIMGLQAIGDTLSFGSQTAAADGNVTFVYLPGELTSVFTGLGVLYPDGRSTQRVGMVPDVHVAATIEGLAAGHDEVLEAALDCRWLQETPPKRLPPSGLYYAPQRSGEGLDVHRDAQLVAVLSYGYDDHGQPEWLLSGSAAHDPSWQTGFLRYQAAAGGSVSAALVPGLRSDFHRGPYEPSCAIADQNALHPRASWQWAASESTVCTVPLLLTGSGAATGLWAGPAGEQYWGVSVHQEAGGWLSVFVYAYDEAGAPRWLTGRVEWPGQGVAEIPLQRVTGFCRGCPPATAVHAPAGVLQLSLDGLHSGDAADNWLSIAAQFGPGTAWQRERMPLLRLVGASGR